MNKQIGTATYLESLKIIKRYTENNNLKEKPFEAWIIASSKGSISVKGVFQVLIEINQEDAVLTIVGDNPCTYNYPAIYSAHNYEFKNINNTLIITGEDQLGRTVSVEITPK